MLNGRVRPADTVVVVGAGPIGLAAIATARFYTPERIIAVDLAPARLDAAKRLGADAVASAGDEAEQLVADLTEGLGADVVIEAVGVPGELRGVYAHGAARRPRGQRRGARQARDTPPRRPAGSRT